MMKRVFLFLVLMCALSFPALAAKESEAAKLVKGFYAALEGTMKQGPELGFMGRYKKLAPVIEKAFNLPLMAKYAVGPTWRQTPPASQKKLVDAFSAFSIATYASRFTKFDGEIFEVLCEKEASGGGVMVETRLTPKGEEPVILNYLVRKDEKGKMRIVDVYLDASISELATRRADFTSVIKRDGFDKLIESLKKKAEDMGTTPSG